MNSAHCSRCVCTWMGQIQRTHFTAGYTLYNCVCDKKNLFLFFQNRYPIMVKCLNIGNNIGKPIYRSISKNIYKICQGMIIIEGELLQAEVMFW